MKYYSEITNELYDSTEELLAAEEELLNEQKEKEAMAAERELRRAEVDEAFAKFKDLRQKFFEDYGELLVYNDSPIIEELSRIRKAFGNFIY